MASGKLEDIATVKDFKQFDIVTDCSDHRYNPSTSDPDNDALTRAYNAVTRKKIMQEWRILEENLPKTIFVRVYEGRIDLLRAVIIGASLTPYHDSLFFFDISFPLDYPNKPPLVYYHSHGLRLNPNLYEDGNVCLSILNTWRGEANENWTPDSSTVLQVLVSIQGLVLNQKPYYNEPGAKPAISWQAYNRDIFLLSCQAMRYHLRHPPKNFEDFVASHFRERAHQILKACRDYINGRASIGYIEDGSSNIEVPSTFKLKMMKIYEFLEVEFKKDVIAEPEQTEVKEENNERKQEADCSKLKETEMKSGYWTRTKKNFLMILRCNWAWKC